MKKILITGGSGLLSINWAIAYRDYYDIVLGVHNRNVTLRGVTTTKIHLDSVDEFNCDLLVIQPDLVIHTAAFSNVELCESNSEFAKQVNVQLSANVAQICNTHNIPLVHISTDHLFSGNTPFVKEECRPAPLNFYGKTKAHAEEEVQNKNKNALIIRTNFFGWGTSYRRSFSDIIIDTLRSEKKIALFKDVFYTPILISQLANTVHNLLEKRESGIFNIVSDERISKYNFGLKIAEVFNLNASLIQPITLASIKDLVQRPLDMSLSNVKVKNLLAIKFDDIDSQLRMLLFQEEKGLATELKNIRYDG